jgi:lysosomal alpha-mannosidase
MRGGYCNVFQYLPRLLYGCVSICRNSSTPFPVAGSQSVSVTVVNGPVVNEVWQTFGSWAFQTIRLWINSSNVEFDWIVGPINVTDNWGKEVISQYTTNFNTNATWYTDSNCREMQQRRRNFRPTWHLNVTEPVSENYFPVNCAIQTTDVSTGATFSITTDRSQGGSSMNDGQLELMVHRR